MVKEYTFDVLKDLRDPVREGVFSKLKPTVFETLSKEEIEECIEEALQPLTAIDIAIIAEISDKLCEKCGECCRNCDPIFLTEKDAYILRKNLGKEVMHYLVRYRNGWKIKKTRPCIFFDEQTNLCTIYEIRPSVCRLFPLTEDKKYGLVLQVFPYCKIPLNFAIYRAIGCVVRKYLEKVEA